jgi:hypothetical protein
MLRSQFQIGIPFFLSFFLHHQIVNCPCADAK